MRGCIDGQQSMVNGQRSIDELRIVPLVSLDDARGDFFADKIWQNLLKLANFAKISKFY